MIPQGADTGEFEVTATAGAFSARAVATVVTADRYRDLVATQLEASDAAVETPVIENGPRVGAVAVTTPAPSPSTPPLVWALVALSALLGVTGAALADASSKARAEAAGL